jgi:predicted branched-subunit amino acid permease
MLVFMLMRILRNRRLSPRERRRRAIRMATIYLCIFLGLGLIFLILGLANYISSYQYPMMICFVYAGVELLLIVFCVLRSREFR